MSVVLVLLALVFALGAWGYSQQGDVLYAAKKITGGILSPSQIAQYAAQAGFTGSNLVIAVAIALGESSGDPSAHGDRTIGSGAGSWGLWQIYLDAHPEYQGVDLTDPATNAAAAFSIFSARGNFTDWSVYNNAFKSPQVHPNYLDFFDDASAGVAALQG